MSFGNTQNNESIWVNVCRMHRKCQIAKRVPVLTMPEYAFLSLHACRSLQSRKIFYVRSFSVIHLRGFYCPPRFYCPRNTGGSLHQLEVLLCIRVTTPMLERSMINGMAHYSQVSRVLSANEQYLCYLFD